MKLDEERVKHWLGVGAQPTDRVLRFLDKAGLAKREARSNPNKGQPGKKRIEREEAKVAAQAEKAKAAAEAERPLPKLRRPSSRPSLRLPPRKNQPTRAEQPGLRIAFGDGVGEMTDQRPRAARRDRAPARAEGRGAHPLLHRRSPPPSPSYGAARGRDGRTHDRVREPAERRQGRGRAHQGRGDAGRRRGADRDQALCPPLAPAGARARRSGTMPI